MSFSLQLTGRGAVIELLSRAISKIGRRGRASGAPLPPGLRIYAIGDIHGRADLLHHLHAEIAQDLERSPVREVCLVYLGDYLDRGPGSAAVLDLLVHSPFPRAKRHFLKGNHEAMALAFLEDPTGAASWLQYGGRETLQSYGIDPGFPRGRRELVRLRDRFYRRLPKSHLALLERLNLSCEVGDFLFVHAGIDPDRPLSRQRENDLLWIREPFLSHPGPFERIVVHGHTPSPEPENLPFRINVDTGAFLSGRLTALVLEGENRRFLTKTATPSDEMDSRNAPSS